MTVEDVIVKLFENKKIPINDKIVEFGYNHNLTVRDEESSVKGHYSFVIRNERIVLRTDTPLIGNERELIIDIVIGGQVALSFS